MFEKEAENYAKDCEKEFHTSYGACLHSFRDGAEFGYNKANEWHYSSKGEYPKECENVLCYCKAANVKFYSIGHTIIGGDNKIRWWSNNKAEELKVYAWKEITPPKEIKDELKNRISMVLKDPVLQQGFEIICKENTELKGEANSVLNNWCKGDEQLTKAKEIIKKFSEFVNNEIEFDPIHPQEYTDLWNELCEKAEQFLNSEVKDDRQRKT
nr:MAG TPA: hypothetical protein [Caudoviricetes sp.]